MTTESSPTASMALTLLRNFVTSLFIVADKSLLNLAGKHSLLETLRCWLVASFRFLLRLIPSLNPNSPPPRKHARNETPIDLAGAEDSGIARALSQLLSIASDLPASSRKREAVRSLAEGILEENQRDGVEVLREVNRTALSAAFERTLGRLEEVAAEQGGEPAEFWLNRVLRAVAWAREEGAREEEGVSGEKLAAESLWLSEKMAACGFSGEAVLRWASASNLAWLALYTEPPLQGSLLKSQLSCSSKPRKWDMKSM